MNDPQKTPQVPPATPREPSGQPPKAPVPPSSGSPVPPATVVDGTPVQFTAPRDQSGLLLEPKPSKWRYLFIVLGILQAVGVAICVFGSIWASRQAKAGVSGTEFFGLFLLVTVVPATVIVAFMNLVGLPIYLVKHRPRGKGLVFAIVSLAISALLALYGCFAVYQLYAAPHRYEAEYQQKSEQRDREFAAANTKPEITKEEAISLLKNCSLKGFYYTGQTKSESLQGVLFPAAETSSNGVVLVKVDGKPYRISIADRLIPELVPIAREAQKTCTNPQFWHDGTYEQFKDGKWYFNNQIANPMETGKTEQEVLSLLQSCKVDYFVGYTGDLSVEKEESTKAWLQKAEKSDTGLETSENAPKTYVFASKAMTAKLQNTARQLRQTCYDVRKLYITIDDTIETEYPVGTWTKVKR
ncbi:MFS transporter [Candidatus Saccharibacteria bacterium]|nr:MAG: MFS transporter [Candidatus Saccharibacteria bacterium]